LNPKVVQPKTAPFVVKARPLGLRAGFDPGGFNRLADDLEADGFLKANRAASSP